MSGKIDPNINKSICPYPWYHSYSGSRYERKLCCISDNLDSNKQTNSEYWNSPEIKKIRLDMIAGNKVDICKQCYYLESSGISSLRQESISDFTIEKLEEVVSRTNDDGSIDFLPQFYDYRTVHCNLQCLSCGPIFSSQHLLLHNKRYPKDNMFVIDKEFEQKLTDEMLEGLLSKRITRIYWAGGEPMMSTMHWAIIEKMKELASINSDWENYIMQIRMHYNSNLTRKLWKGKNVYELLSSFKNLVMQASIDGVKETFEYTRDGAIWQEVEDNWNKAYAMGLDLQVACVLSAPVLIDIDRWVDFFEPFEPYTFTHKFTSNLLDNPYNSPLMLDIRYYPKPIFDRVINNALKRFENSNKLKNISKGISVLNALRKEKEDSSNLFDNINVIKKLKKESEERDRFHMHGKKFVDLLKKIDDEIYNWYISL